MYEYMVVPFQGQAKGVVDTKSAAGVAQQLGDLINKQVSLGWEFVETAKVTVAVAPGCLGRFMGAGASFVAIDQIIFRRAK